MTAPASFAHLARFAIPAGAVGPFSARTGPGPNPTQPGEAVVNALVRERTLSAHDLFKDQYARTLRWSVLGALVVLVIGVLVMPEYRPVPYRLAQDPTILTEFELEPPAIVEPPPIAQPRQPDIAPVEDEDPRAVDPPPWVDPYIRIPYDPRGVVAPVDDTPFVATSANPRLLQGAMADYPEMARLAGMQGTVMVKVLVESDGTVGRVEILKGVHPLLDKPALAAARKLVFAPGTQRGVPVPCNVAVPFRFYLH